MYRPQATMGSSQYYEYTPEEQERAIEYQNETTHLTKEGARINTNNFNDYQLSKASQMLYKKNLEESIKNQEYKEKESFFHMTLQEIGTRFLRVMNQILLDLSHLFTKYQAQERVTFKEWMLVFIRDDRIFYVGILFFFLSLAMYFISIDEM
jgi:hypothetical protein